ncbi:PREDICTED: alpha carbonic anhydrase 1, chloroplastic-like [Camelina sativa]|uniref:Carbonic anhydrase n=1 Tax=Camelina sativa TaxID=90675 RepID=A0ABM0ZHC3_CAMSA|nr:PREDICTED: alpha carbonic anhydrase 1, chloroplastic-like [Camelina sativa]
MKNKTMITISYFVLALLCIGPSDAQTQGVGFGYRGKNGPYQWGHLNPHFTKCAVGKLQSPIDIQRRQIFYNRKLESLHRDYFITNATLVDHVCNVAMVFGEGAGDVIIENKNYTLVQMHWHTPSEHHLHGVQYAAELHMVHQAKDGSFAVVASLFKIGAEEPFLSQMKGRLVKLKEERSKGNQTAQVEVGKIDTRHIERKTRKFYRYVGSLTTPPCSENVIWTILGKVRSMSKEQVELLKSPLDTSFKNNARPCQPLNGRRVEMFHELVDAKETGNKKKKPAIRRRNPIKN